MRTALLTIVAAASALGLAAPASAQRYPPPTYGHGYGYGYHDDWGQVRHLDARIDALQRHINRLDRRNVLSRRDAARLRFQAHDLERRLHWSARNGLHPAERYEIERRIARLEQRIWREAHDGRYWGRYGYGYGW